MTTETKGRRPETTLHAKHSSVNQDAMTPPWIIEATKKVFRRPIDLDPASSARANRSVGARYYLTKRENGLGPHWWRDDRFSDGEELSTWLNPPGGLFPDGRSRMKAWWKRLMKEREDYNRPHRHFGQAMFLAFSIEALQVTQLDCDAPMLDFPTCIFRRRVHFYHGRTGQIMIGNSHASALIYIPGRIDHSKTFARVFSKHGRVVETVR